MRSWHLYPIIVASMPFQMALDEILLRRFWTSEPAPPPLFRIFYSAGNWTTVGFSHPVESSKAEHICRRITGGGLVEHGADLLFSLCARKEHDESFHSVRISYWKIHEAIKQGFESLGVRLDFYRCDQNLPRGAACFQFPIATDLAYQNHKIAGGAQKRMQGAMLHQESIRRPGRMSFEDMERAVKMGMEKVFVVSLEAVPALPRELEESHELAKTKYQGSHLSLAEMYGRV